MTHPPNFLKDSNASLKVKTMEEARVEGHSLVHNTSGVKGACQSSRIGIRMNDNMSIIHNNLHKPNNKLVSAQLEHFWCTNKPRAYTNSQDSPRLGFGGSHHLPPYSILCVWPWGLHPNGVFLETSKLRVMKFPKVRLLPFQMPITSCENL